jgi:hypothetical protein
MTRRNPLGPLDPIFDVETTYGGVAVGNTPGYNPIVPPEVVGTTTQTTGSGTTSVQSIVPAPVEDGDAVTVILRVSGSITAQPTGFTTKHTYNYLASEFIYVCSGIYVFATHGGTLTFTTDPGVCRTIFYYIRSADPASSGFVFNNIGGGSDQFFPTLTTPSGDSMGICYGFAGGAYSDLQDNGWTEDYNNGNALAYSQAFNGAAAQTMPRWDNINNVYQIAYYLTT